MTSPDKVSVLCRYGGNFVMELDKISYKDGTNRIIRMNREIKYHSLLSKVQEVCKSANIDSIEYQHPQLDLDCRLSVENDEDISSMMQAFSQSHGPIHLFVSEAQRIPSIHNVVSSNDEEIVEAILENCHGSQERSHQHNSNNDINANTSTHSSNDEEIVEATLENCHGSQERSLQHNSNNDINADTSTPIDMQGMDDFRMDNRRLPYSNADDCVNDTQMMKLEEGQKFSDADAFHKFLREYAIRNNFEYKRTRSGHGRFAAKCSKPDCLWRIQAVQLSNMCTFKIKSLTGNHTCNVYKQPTMSNLREHRQATRRWIADTIEGWDYSECTPEDIVAKIGKEYGIKLSYWKAWRGKELALERMNKALPSNIKKQRRYKENKSRKYGNT